MQHLQWKIRADLFQLIKVEWVREVLAATTAAAAAAAADPTAIVRIQKQMKEQTKTDAVEWISICCSRKI